MGSGKGRSKRTQAVKAAASTTASITNGLPKILRDALMGNLDGIEKEEEAYLANEKNAIKQLDPVARDKWTEFLKNAEIERVTISQYYFGCDNGFDSFNSPSDFYEKVA